MAIYVRLLRDSEQKRLQELARHREDVHMSKRARIILLSAQGYTVPQISAQVGLHPINVRKWIHRFNERGISGLQSGKSPGRPPRFTPEQKRAIIALARVNPRELGLPFERWSLQKLRKHAVERGIVDSISAETIRQILRSGWEEQAIRYDGASGEAARSQRVAEELERVEMERRESESKAA